MSAFHRVAASFHFPASLILPGFGRFRRQRQVSVCVMIVVTARRNIRRRRLLFLLQRFVSISAHHSAIHVDLTVDSDATSVMKAPADADTDAAAVHHAGRVAAHGVVVEQTDDVLVKSLASDVARKSVQMVRDFDVGVVTQENRCGFITSLASGEEKRSLVLGVLSVPMEVGRGVG